MYVKNRLLLLCTFASILASCASDRREIEKEMTIKVKPGAIDCFYETISSGDIIDLEYQVSYFCIKQWY